MKKNITVILTDKCNLKCKHCFQSKTGISMSETVLKQTVRYIINQINSDNDDYHIRLWGGEILTYDKQLLIDQINKLRRECNRPITIYTQSNLITSDIESYMSLFKLLDYVDTSYDYSVRFTNLDTRINWINNVKHLINNGITTSCTISLTKDLIENVTPQSLFDLMLSLGIQNIELERMLKPIRDIPNFEALCAKNTKVTEWLFEAYKLYEKLKKHNIYVETFNCIEESIKGNFYYEHSRSCNKSDITITPLGKVTKCYMLREKPYADVFTNELDTKTLYKLIIDEETLPNDCINCKLLKYCRGDCQFMWWDETGCSTPKLIYEYILSKD